MVRKLNVYRGMVFNEWSIGDRLISVDSLEVGSTLGTASGNVRSPCFAHSRGKHRTVLYDHKIQEGQSLTPLLRFLVQLSDSTSSQTTSNWLSDWFIQMQQTYIHNKSEIKHQRNTEIQTRTKKTKPVLPFYHLEPPSTAPQRYNLRERTHSLQLPEHSAHLSDCNFITHMLYKNTY